MARRWSSLLAALALAVPILPGSTSSAVGRGGDDDGFVRPLTAASGDEDFALAVTGTSNTNNSYAQSTSTTFTSSMQGAFTIEAWVKPTRCVAESAVVFKESSFMVTCMAGTWQYYLSRGGSGWGGSGWRSTGISARFGEWQHIALTRSAASAAIEFHVDGQLAHTGGAWNESIGNNTSAPLLIGTRRDGNAAVGFDAYFDGQIDEVRLWNTYRGASIATDMHTHALTGDTTGLVAYYDFNEGPAGTTGTGTAVNRVGTDTSTNLRLINSPTYVAVEEAVTSGSTTTVTFPRSYLTAAGGWRVPQSVANVDVAVVGAGGAGGWNAAGGGGGGGVTQAAPAVTAGSVARVTVGQGGVPTGWASGTVQSTIDAFHTANPSVGNGQASIFAGQTGPGGQRGASRGWDFTLTATGGSGGAGSTASGGVGGSAAGASANGGTGGAGTSLTSPLSGTYAAGGGGGAGWNSGTLGGAAGDSSGAAGGNFNANGSSAPANRGGGGGGASGGGYIGGRGGSGVVIVQYSGTSAAPGECAPASTTMVDGSTTYRVFAFTSIGTCTWEVPEGVTEVDYLVVAGGGGGGYGVAGGGGAGGLLEGTALDATAGSSVQVTVGAGGVGGTSAASSARRGGRGGLSRLTGTGVASTITTFGGGGGGGYSNDWGTGLDGGSGGGGSATAAGGPGTSGQGTSGGPSSGDYTLGGGGGGAATAGGTSGGGSGAAATIITASVASTLGIGDIGASAFFAGGGGGGANGRSGRTAGAGGVGGGGSGSNSSAVGGAGQANTGGGGGGGSGYENSGLAFTGGGAGGSGVVVLRYALSASVPCEPLVYSYSDTSTTPATQYTVAEFRDAGSCAWTVPGRVNSVDALVVGGGGAGANSIGGGGGGGEVLPLSGAGVTPGGTETVTVGGGGVPGAGATVGGNGGNSSAFSGTARGGGGGGTVNNGWAVAGVAGGSGGGGGCAAGGGTAPGGSTAVTPGKGHPGGAGYGLGSEWCVAGGGGGAGGAGGAANGGTQSGGAGGPGASSSLTGATVYYGGGGGGGVNGDSAALSAGQPGIGGIGGGGAGAAKGLSGVGFDGTDGLGGGGGGSSNNGGGGDGGDGVVIVRYLSNWLSLTAGSGREPSDYVYSPAVADWETTAPKVQIVDADGSAVASSGVTVTATFTASSGSATLVNGTATTDADGVADFSSLVLNGNAGTAGTLTFTATGHGSITSSSVTIGEAALTVTASSHSVTYGDATPTITPSYSGLVNGETAAVVTTAPTCSTTYTPTSSAATTPSTSCTGAAATNYTFTYVDGAVTIAKADQAALTVTSTSGTYGTAVDLATSGGSGTGAVSFTASNGTAGGCAVVSGDLVSTTAGTCLVTATKAGDADHNAVSSSATTVTLGKVNLTISGAVAENKQYDGNRTATLDFSSATLVGVVAGDSTAQVAIDGSSATGTFATAAVGEDIAVTVTGVTLSGTKAASSYTVSQPTGVTADISAASRTITFSTTSHSVTYGDAAFTVTATPSVGSGTVTYSATGAACTVDQSTGEVTITAAGSCQISASVTADGTYLAASTTASATVTVARASLAVTASSPPVTYGDAVPTITPSYSGFVNGETVAVLTTTPTCTTTYVRTSAVASTPSTSCSGAVAENYAFVYSPGSVTIGRASLTVTASSPSVTYGDAMPTITPSYSGFVNGESASVLTTAPTCTTTYTRTSSVGTAPSTSCSGTAAANYDIAHTPGSVTITQATPTFSWTNDSRTFGDDPYTVPAPTASTAGTFAYASSDTSVISTSGTTATVAGAGSATITATFTPADTTNFVSGGTVTQTVTVAKATQSALTLTSTTGTYGAALTLTTTGGTTGLAVTYVVSNGSATGCVETTGSLTVSTAGTCVVTARMAGDDDHLPVLSTATTITFAKATQTITFADPAPSGATFGDPVIPVTPTSDSGLPVTLTATDTSVCTVGGGGITIVSAGTCEVTARQAGDGNFLAAADVQHTFAVAKAAQAPLTMTSPATVTHGGTIDLAAAGGSGTGTLTFRVSNGTCTIDGGTTLVPGDAGSVCSVQATRQGDTNHLAMSSATQPITITQAGQTLAFTSSVPTAPVSGDTYTPTVTATSTETGGPSAVTPTISASGTCGIAGGVVTFVAAGPCTITASAAGNVNFTAATDVTQTIVVGSINQNITFVQPDDVAFGSASVPTGATASSGLPVTHTLGAATTNSACAVSTLGVVSILAVGICEIVTSQAGDASFAAASDVTRTFRVVPALATAPTLRSASASSQAITVAVAEPGFTGGVPITAYEVTATPTGGGTVVTDSACTASPCTIEGLVNGTEYTVSVAAINAAGTGPASVSTGPLTPATAAFAVEALSAVPGDTVVDLDWTALTTAQLGGGAFTRYEVSYRPAGLTPEADWTLATDTLTSQSTDTHRVTGLDNGTSYDFRVVAITAANADEIPGNTALVVQYPATVPSVPRSVAVLVATPTDVELSWEVPATDGGEPITGYAVSVTSTSPGAATPVACTVVGAATRCTASNLTNGAVYDIAVEAVNRMSTGSNGNPATLTYNVPSSDSTLSALTLTGGGAAIEMSPAFDPAITEYVAEVDHDIDSVTVTPTPARAASTVTAGGSVVAYGTSSEPIALTVGDNDVTIAVRASDPRFSTVYTVTVTRAEAPVAITPAAPSAGVPGRAPTPATVSVGSDGRALEVSAVPGDAMSGDAVVVDADGVARAVSYTVDGTGGDTTLSVGGGPSLGDVALSVRGVDPGAVGVDPASARFTVLAGSRLEVTGSGYSASTEVEVWLLSTPTFLGSAVVDADGRWTLETRIPNGITAGAHHLQAEGTAADGVDRILRAVVVVEQPLSALELPKSGAEHRRVIDIAILVAALGALAAMVVGGRGRRPLRTSW